jgi:ubiquinone/menaquinone biosynthesis C-methylase UbiE
VLDVGCGLGHPAMRLAETCDVDVVGITVSHLQVQQATGRAVAAGLQDKVRFQYADAMELPFPDGSFDAAWALESMLHMPDRGQVLREIGRVLRPGGRLAVADIVERGPVSAEGREVLDHICETYQVTSLGTAEEYADRLAASGFTEVAIYDISENVNRSGAVLADLIESVHDKFADVVGAEEAGTLLRFMRRAAATPENGYLYFTAVRS